MPVLKKFSHSDITSIKNNFLTNCKTFLTREKCQTLRHARKEFFKFGPEVYHCTRSEISMKREKSGDTLIISDFSDAIQVIIPHDQLSKRDSLLKNEKKSTRGHQTIEQILAQACESGAIREHLDGKNILVYDVETDAETFDVSQQNITLAYYATLGDDNKIKYHYVGENDVEKFADTLLDFDGYVIGFNSFGFDNPVTLKNAGKSDADLAKLNAKSLDILQFIYLLAGRRIGLSKLSSALFNVAKTLESGLEASNLYREYKKTGDTKLLETCKKYCKNDVRMTVLLFFYFIHFKTFFLDDAEYHFTIQDFLQKASTPPTSSKNTQKSTATQTQSIF